MLRCRRVLRAASFPILSDKEREKLGLSVFVITKNEVERLGKMLESVRPLASEIIVVDSGSTDGTCELAKCYGARVFQREWTGFGAQKCFAEAQCRGAWLLNLDADEALSPEAAEEIQRRIPTEEADVYDLRIALVPLGRARPPFGGPVNRTPRLYRREMAFFSSDPVLDKLHPLPSARRACIRSSVYHRSLKSYTHMWEKALTYALMQAEKRAALRKKPNRALLPLTVPAFFIKHYFLRRLCFCGIEGLLQALTLSSAHLLRDLEIHRLIAAQVPSKENPS